MSIPSFKERMQPYHEEMNHLASQNRSQEQYLLGLQQIQVGMTTKIEQISKQPDLSKTQYQKIQELMQGILNAGQLCSSLVKSIAQNDQRILALKMQVEGEMLAEQRKKLANIHQIIKNQEKQK